LDGLSASERSEVEVFDAACRRLFDALQSRPSMSPRELRQRIFELDPEFDLVKQELDPAGVIWLELQGLDAVAKPRLERLASLAPSSVRVRTDPGPRSLEEVSAAVEQSTGRSLGGARVRAGFARGHLLDLLVHLPKTSNRDDPVALSAAESAVYGLLGERRADDWIGRIDVAPLQRAGPLRLVGSGTDTEHTFPLSLVPTTVENAIRGL
jgi:hypothetical protein